MTRLVLSLSKVPILVRLKSSLQKIKQSGNKNKRRLTKEQMRERALIDIYFFYCKLLYYHGPRVDFDRMSQDTQLMSIGKFMLMCRQFDILDGRLRITSDASVVESTLIDIKSNKTKLNQQNDHKWWLKEEYQEQRVKYFENLQQEYNKVYRRLTRQEITNIFRKISPNQKEVNFWEWKTLLQAIASKMFEGSSDSLEMLYLNVLKLDKNGYKSLLKDINSVAFGIHEKVGFRQPPGYEDYLYKHPQSNQLKKQAVSQWQLLRASELHNRLVDSKPKQKPHLNSELIRKSQGLVKPPQSNYNSIANRIHQKPEKILTWEALDQISYHDVLDNKSDHFRPIDLIDDNSDPEDEYYLKGLEIKNEKEQRFVREKKINQSLNIYGRVDSSDHKLKLAPSPVYPKSLQAVQSQPSIKKNASYRGKYSRQSSTDDHDSLHSNNHLPSAKGPLRQLYGIISNQRDIKGEYLKRAQQLEAHSKIYINPENFFALKSQIKK